MIVSMSEDASNVALDALGAMMNGGSIEMLSADGNVIATLKLSSPAAQDAVGGELTLNEIGEGVAVTRGQVATARVLARDGGEVLVCDVSDEAGDGVIKLNTTTIARGSPVRIGSFRLAMP